MGDCLAGWFPPDRHASHPLESVIPDGVLIQVGPPDDEHLLLETCRDVEIKTLKKSASSWSLIRIKDTLSEIHYPVHLRQINRSW